MKEKPFWIGVSDKKPPANTAIFVRGANFECCGFLLAQKYFFALKQVYDDEGNLSHVPLDGVTHWASIPLLEDKAKGNLTVCPALKTGVLPFLNEDCSAHMAVDYANFFPEKGRYFTLLTDDGKIFIPTCDNETGKVLRTPRDSGETGLYFRSRLGLKSAVQVTTQDLRNYGRTDVDFYKLDDENYIMDFSKP